MGADTIASTLLLFIAVMVMTTGAVVVLSEYVTKTSFAVKNKQAQMLAQIQTSIEITNVNCTGGTWSRIYAKNTGTTTIDTNYLELYVDNEWVKNTSFQVLDPNTEAPVSLWSPRQTVLINATHQFLSSGAIHQVKITTDNAVSDSYLFSF